MADPTPNPPLWEVMQGSHQDAYDRGLSVESGYAAELRAIAEWLVPEEAKPQPGRVEPGGTRMYFHETFARWEERQFARRRLLAEADRAEVGE